MSMMNPDRVADTLNLAVQDMIGRGDMDSGERLAAYMIYEVELALRTDAIPPTITGALTWIEQCLSRAVESEVDELVH